MEADWRGAQRGDSRDMAAGRRHQDGTGASRLDQSGAGVSAKVGSFSATTAEQSHVGWATCNSAH